MKKKFKGLGVDAGNISVIDVDYTDKIGGEVIELPSPGIYDVKIKIKDCWNGPTEESGRITSRSGKLVVGDACYSISDRWHDFLAESDHGQNASDYFVWCNTGGDGVFDVTVEYKLVTKEILMSKKAMVKGE